MTTLLESLLMSEFTFGFELEAYINRDIFWKYISDIDNIDNESMDDEEYEEYESSIVNNYNTDDYKPYFKYVAEYFSQWFGNDCKIVNDGSLGFGGFEFPTPPMNLTPANIKNCINFLMEIQKGPYKIYTDESCGFHVHFSFPHMNHQDMAWILCNIALNADDCLSDFSAFIKADGNQQQFFSKQWSDPTFLFNLQKAIKEENWTEVSKIISSEKYRLIRLHPQGTIEWRGPRNFISKNGIQDITSFFYQVLKIAKHISNFMDETSINGMSKENFFKMINLENIEEKEKYYHPDKVVTLMKEAIKNPLILTKLKPSNISEQLIKHLYVKLSKIKFANLLTTLRYKKFNDLNILYNIIELYPTFFKYCEQQDKILDKIGKYRSAIKILSTGRGFSKDLILKIMESDSQRTICSRYFNTLRDMSETTREHSWLLKPSAINYIKTHVKPEEIKYTIDSTGLDEKYYDIFGVKNS